MLLFLVGLKLDVHRELHGRIAVGFRICVRNRLIMVMVASRTFVASSHGRPHCRSMQLATGPLGVRLAGERNGEVGLVERCSPQEPERAG